MQLIICSSRCASNRSITCSQATITGTLPALESFDHEFGAEMWIVVLGFIDFFFAHELYLLRLLD
jgi:hypothetical protein